MKNLLRYGAVILLILFVNKSLNAQEYYSIYKTFDAVMLQTQGNLETEQLLNNTIVVFPDNTNKLDIFLKIPYSAVENQFDIDSVASNSLLFNLTMDIDWIDIQENLTSSKTFTTHGLLSLNGSTKWVTVSYMPVASGTEESGNFNISLIIQFNGVNFNLAPSDNDIQFKVKIDNVKVNRV